ncbi:hypothetical protein NITHO_2280004 [Nitrolancea hollandica Lb]|uniref:Uncharacterized protein n=1 Tax=Nitrolancea hollandica Lb TaxID=1129897 RepID=I4EFE9_9BACT|nr:hypothetical protein NITHO_2280004 [Nitrolancea hollandica Lb]
MFPDDVNQHRALFRPDNRPALLLRLRFDLVEYLFRSRHPSSPSHASRGQPSRNTGIAGCNSLNLLANRRIREAHAGNMHRTVITSGSEHAMVVARQKSGSPALGTRAGRDDEFRLPRYSPSNGRLYPR